MGNIDRLDEILEKQFTNIFRAGYVTIDGVALPKRYAEMKEDIDNLEINEEDVWICTFPKSGTTWTQEMVWMIVHNLDFEQGKNLNICARSPYLEVSAIYDYRQVEKNNKDFDAPLFMADSVKYVKNQESPACIKTHLPWNLLPKQIKNGEKKPKIIYVMRNPKDTCTSYYHHAKLMEGYTGNFEDFFELFLSDKLSFCPYWNHILGYWDRRDSPNVLFLKYEDMKSDLPSVIRKTADFLNKKLTTEQVEILTQHLSFESMKNNSSVNYELVVNLNRKYKLVDQEGSFMRSGSVGNYKTLMTPEMIERIEKWTDENLKKSDFKF